MVSSVNPPTAALPNMPTPSSPPPLFGASQQSPGQKPRRASFFPTFLGSGDVPSAGQLGQKTLLGT